MRQMLTILAAVGLSAAGVAVGGMEQGNGTPMNAAQADAMFGQVKHSLVDSIKAAEQKAGGRAIAAECRYCSPGDKADARRGTDKDGMQDVVCVVTVLTNNKTLAEVQVDPGTGKVLSQRQIQSMPGRADTDWSARNVAHTDTAHRIHSGDDFAAPHRWQKATDLTGKSIRNAASEDLGTLQDIVVDAKSGRILYGVVSYGGFMGLGDKLFAVPWHSLELPTDAKKFVLEVDQERLKSAEGFNQNQWPNFADERWATSNYQHYGQKPYWNDGSAGDSYRDRWTQKVAVWQKTSDLCGKSVRTTGSEDLGTMSDLAIDPDSGRIIYGILSFDGKLFAVPWNAVSLTDDAKYFTVNVDKTALKNADGFSSDRWPDLTDQGWARETHQLFHVQPYWVER